MTTTDCNIDATHAGDHSNVRHIVVSKVRGRFTQFTGGHHLNESELASSFEASIGDGSRRTDTHLRSPNFFGVEPFPGLGFQRTRVEKTDDSRYRVVGDLTIHGVTREVTLDANVQRILYVREGEPCIGEARARLRPTQVGWLGRLSTVYQKYQAGMFRRY